MSTLVKLSDGMLQGRIRAFRHVSPGGETAGSEARPDRVEETATAAAEASPASETEALASRIGVLETELERVRSEAAMESEKRFEDGRAAGLLEAEKAERDRLEILGQAAATLSGKAEEAFKSLETLGVALAGVAIGKVLGDGNAYRQDRKSVV